MAPCAAAMRLPTHPRRWFRGGRSRVNCGSQGGSGARQRSSGRDYLGFAPNRQLGNQCHPERSQHCSSEVLEGGLWINCGGAAVEEEAGNSWCGWRNSTSSQAQILGHPDAHGRGYCFLAQAVAVRSGVCASTRSERTRTCAKQLFADSPYARLSVGIFVRIEWKRPRHNSALTGSRATALAERIAFRRIKRTTATVGVDDLHRTGSQQRQLLIFSIVYANAAKRSQQRRTTRYSAGFAHDSRRKFAL